MTVALYRKDMTLEYINYAQFDENGYVQEYTMEWVVFQEGKKAHMKNSVYLLSNLYHKTDEGFIRVYIEK